MMAKPKNVCTNDKTTSCNCKAAPTQIEDDSVEKLENGNKEWFKKKVKIVIGTKNYGIYHQSRFQPEGY